MSLTRLKGTSALIPCSRGRLRVNSYTNTRPPSHCAFGKERTSSGCPGVQVLGVLGDEFSGTEGLHVEITQIHFHFSSAWHDVCDIITSQEKHTLTQKKKPLHLHDSTGKTPKICTCRGEKPVPKRLRKSATPSASLRELHPIILCISINLCLSTW